MFDTLVKKDNEKVTIFRVNHLYQELTPSQYPFESFIRRRKYVFISNNVPPINPGFDDYQIDNVIKQSHDLIEKVEAYYDSDSIFIERKITIVNKRYTQVGFMYLHLLIEKGKLKEYSKTYEFFDAATDEDVQDKFNLKGHYINGKLSVLHKYKAAL